MSQLPLKLKNYIICLFNLEYGGIQNGQFYTWMEFDGTNENPPKKHVIYVFCCALYFMVWWY
jgi:hypothetical protein